MIHDKREAFFVQRLSMLLRWLLVCFPIGMAIVVWKRSVDVPFSDEWEWAQLIILFHHGSLTFAKLWAQHNEHRILFPSIIAIALDSFGGWAMIREQFVSLSLLVITQAILVAMLYRTSRSLINAVAAIFASFLLYGFWQYENLSWGFQMAWFICNACAVGVAFLLGRADRTRLQVAGAALLSAIASFSSSQGLLVWAVGAVALALAQRRSGITLVAWFFGAVATYFVYANGLMETPNIGHISVGARPLLALKFALVYLGSPLFSWAGTLASSITGAIAVGALALSFASDVFSRERIRRLVRSAPWYALAVYPIAAAIATASGRAGSGYSFAFAPRYTSISALLYIAIVGLILSDFAGMPRRLRRAARVVWTAAVAATIFAGMIWRGDLEGWRNWALYSATLASARAELIANDPMALQVLYPAPAVALERLAELRALHEWIFERP